MTQSTTSATSGVYGFIKMLAMAYPYSEEDSLEPGFVDPARVPEDVKSIQAKKVEKPVEPPPAEEGEGAETEGAEEEGGD